MRFLYIHVWYHKFTENFEYNLYFNLIVFQLENTCHAEFWTELVTSDKIYIVEEVAHQNFFNLQMYGSQYQHILPSIIKKNYYVLTLLHKFVFIFSHISKQLMLIFNAQYPILSHHVFLWVIQSWQIIFNFWHHI